MTRLNLVEVCSMITSSSRGRASKQHQPRLRRRPMLAAFGAIALIGSALGLIGCAEDVDVRPAEQRTRALFDLSTRVLPTPIDLARNLETGLLQVPVADPERAPAQAAFDRYLNTLDGFPVSSALMLCFSADVQLETLRQGLHVYALPREPGQPAVSVPDVAIGAPQATLACPVLTAALCDPQAAQTGCAAGQRCVPTSSVLQNKGQCANAGYAVSLRKSTPWNRAQTYAVIATDEIQDLEGRGVLRSATFDLIAQSAPLCVWDATAQRCTFNYSSLAAAEARRSFEEQQLELSTEDRQRLLHEAELEAATQLEQLRRGLDRVLRLANGAGIDRKHVVLAWTFTTVGMVEALFDPVAGIIPGPGNDLLRDAGRLSATGDPEPLLSIPGPICTASSDCALGTCQLEQLQVGAAPLPQCSTRAADQPGDWRMLAGRHQDEDEASWQLRLAMNRSLDGFSTTATYFTPVSGVVDAASVGQAGELLVINLTEPSAPPAQVRFGFDATARAITMTPELPLRERSQYAVILRSRLRTGTLIDTSTAVPPLVAEAAGGLADPDGRRLVPGPIFALARSPAPLVDAEGHSTVSVLDDASAARLEPLRVGYDTLLTQLEAIPGLGVRREDVVALWTMTTQTITEPLVQLRALPYQVLQVVDQGSPQLSGTVIERIDGDGELIGWPAGVPNSNIRAWVAQGRFQSWNALDQATGAFHSDPLQGQPAEVPFFMTLPNAPLCTQQERCPLVVFQHGVTASKKHLFPIADALAAAGLATIAFDAPYHGERTVCSSNADCLQQPIATSCNPGTRRCCAASDANDCQLSYFVDADADGTPDASGGAAFINTSNPFALRDNLRQHVIDSAALLRAVRQGATAGLDGAAPVLDPTSVHFVGHSMGAILGVLVVATEPLSFGEGPQRVALNVPGAPIVRIFQETPDAEFQGLVAGLLAGQGVTPGSLGALRLFHTLQWILDPADPFNFARFVQTEQLPDLVAAQAGQPALVPRKTVMLQVATEDQVIAAARQTALAQALGVDVSKSTFAADHGFLLRPSPSAPAMTAAAQRQIVHFLLSGEICTPNSETGSCE